MIVHSDWPLPLVPQWLGREKPDSTLLYTHLLQEDLFTALAQHPRLQIGASETTGKGGAL